MSPPRVCCPGCGRKVAQEDSDGGGWLARTSVLKVGPGGEVKIRCRHCGGLVALPLTERRTPPLMVRR